jgi:hypothetical protein
MSAFIFAASLGSLPVRDGAVPATVSDAIVSEKVAVPRVTKPLEDERYIRWLKLDRPVPMEDRLDPSMLPSPASALHPDADGTAILLRSFIPR